MSVSNGKSRALKRFLRNKFREPQKQSRSESQSSPQAAALDKGPAYSLSTQIPQKYNDTFVRVIPRDPQNAFVYWERPSQNNFYKDEKDRNADNSGNGAGNGRDVIKIQHIPAFQNVEYPQTVCNFQTDDAFKNDDGNRTDSFCANTVAQINPQSNIGSAYVQTPRGGGEIRAEYGIESGDPQKLSFNILTSSPAAYSSEPSVKQIAYVRKGVDTNALVLFSSVKLNGILHKNISGIDHLSSGGLYSENSEKKS